MRFKGEIWRDDLKIEHYDFDAPTQKKAIEFMEKVRKTKIKGRKGAEGVGVVLRRMYWKIPWFAFYVSMEGKVM